MTEEALARAVYEKAKKASEVSDLVASLQRRKGADRAIWKFKPYLSEGWRICTKKDFERMLSETAVSDYCEMAFGSYRVFVYREAE